MIALLQKRSRCAFAMNRKPRPDSNLKALTEEQVDQLFEMLRVMPYHSAVKHCAEQWGMGTSVSGLRRWWKRESARRMRADLRDRRLESTAKGEEKLAESAKKLNERLAAVKPEQLAAVFDSISAQLKNLETAIKNAEARAKRQ
jgi:hypothetical protein